MKTHFLILLALTGSALAQTSAPPPQLAPELAPLAAKHTADLAAVEAQLKTTVVRSAPFYFAALDSAEKSALASATLDAVAAIHQERDAVNAGKVGDLSAGKFPEKLPAGLKPSRDKLFESYKRIEADSLKLRQRVNADYLRALTALQPKAAGNADLARQIKAESDAVLGNPVAKADGEVEVQAKAGKVINADFSQMDGKGVPVGWKLCGHGDKELQIVPAGTTFSLVKENSHSFMRMSRTDSKGSVFLVQDVEVRRGAREMEVSILYRGEKGQGAVPRASFGFLNEKGEVKEIGLGKDFGTSWKELVAKVDLQKEKDRKVLRIRIGDDSSFGPSKGKPTTGNYDFEKLVVKFK